MFDTAIFKILLSQIQNVNKYHHHLAPLKDIRTCVKFLQIAEKVLYFFYFSINNNPYNAGSRLDLSSDSLGRSSEGFLKKVL